MLQVTRLREEEYQTTQSGLNSPASKSSYAVGREIRQGCVSGLATEGVSQASAAGVVRSRETTTQVASLRKVADSGVAPYGRITLCIGLVPNPGLNPGAKFTTERITARKCQEVR